MGPQCFVVLRLSQFNAKPSGCPAVIDDSLGRLRKSYRGWPVRPASPAE